MIKIGIIGAGNIAMTHAKALSTVKEAVLTGVHDIHQPAGERFASTFGGQAFERYEDLLDSSDGIIVASPNFKHKDHALQALAAGKHVLCEKPMAITLEEAQVMRDYTDKAHAIAMMGFNYRYLSFVHILMEFIRNGGHGGIISFNISFKKDSALRKKAFTWRDSEASKQTSGALGDLGIHLIDMIWYLFRSDFRPESIRVKMATHVKEKENREVQVDDYSEILGQLHNQVFIHMVTSKSTVPEECGFGIEVIGHRKNFYYHTRNPLSYTVTEGISSTSFDLPPALLTDPAGEFHGWADSFRIEQMAWVDAILRKSRMGLPSFADGHRSQATLNLFFETHAKDLSGALVMQA
ncbi:Gfo/Idh/MocA family protein [Paenibacillus chitinolyticus]|uniref:Gfo/Idh/MocA family protein n=1 Tax=Paenibacillus chitinolyticus TaxID=79263 RepID=UPI0036D84D20